MTASGAQLLTAFLAAPPTPPPGKGAEWGKAAPIGLLILVLLGIALYLLIKSMNKHMRNVTGRTSFDDPVPDAAAAQANAISTPAASAAVRTDDADGDAGSGSPAAAADPR